MHRFEMAFGKWVVKHRWWIIVVTLLVVTITASGVRFLTFNNDSRIFFGKDNPQLQALEALENTYTKSDNVLFVIAPKNGDVFTIQTLTALEELTEAAWQIPYSSRVDSIINFQYTHAEGDDLLVENLVDDATKLTESDLERIRNIALNEPMLLNRLISPSGYVTGLNVNIIKPGKSMGESPEVTAFARNMVEEFSIKHPDLDLYLIGGIVMDTAFGEASKDDMSTLVPLMYLTLVVMMGLTLRSFTGTLITLIIIAFSMITGLGLAGWLGISLSAASANSPTIILTLAVADSVHILVSIFHLMRQGKTRHEAVAESLRINLQPVFLTSITTVIGFLTMNFSDAPPFRDLGNIVAMGVAAAFIYSILFLPALISVIPLKVKARAKQKRHIMEHLADFVVNRRKPLFWGVLVAILALTAGTLKIELDDNFIQYFDERYEFRRATDFTIKNLTGFDTIEYSLNSGEPGGINDPSYLNKIEEFANWYRKQPGVVHVSTITDTMKQLNKSMHGDDPNYYRIPESRNLAAQYLLLYEMSLPFGLDMNNQINVEKSATHMRVLMKEVTTKQLRHMDERARNWLAQNAPKEMFTYGSGLSIMFAHISKRNIDSMLGASFMALVLISGILMLALRSFKLGLVSLVPNLAPAFMAFGLWGIIVGQVGLAISVLVALTLGIVVDDTVHFISKYIRARREYGMNPQEAVKYSFHTVGTALWTTSIILVAGFLVLSLSGFKINSDMGLMTAITITLALAMDFLFLPTLLMKVEEKNS